MAFDGSTLAAATSATFVSGVFTDTFTISTTIDVDMVRVELVAGSLYQIDVDHGTASDLLLRVFDAFGNEVKRNDDGFRAVDDVVFSLSPFTDFVPGYSGTYYVAISPYYLSGYNPTTTLGRSSPENPLGTTNGTLTIATATPALFPSSASINAITAESSSDETDALRNDAGRLRVEYSGAVDTSLDVDIGRADLSKGDVVVVDISSDSSTVALGSVLRVFNAAGTQIGFDDDAGFGDESELVFAAPAAGSYYIGISGEGNSSYNGLDGTGTVAGAVGDYGAIVHLNPTQIGTSSVNIFTAGEGADYIVGLGGNDTIAGGDGRDTVSGGDDNDVIQGDLNQDVLYGDAGTDAMNGGGGNDVLVGGTGNDTLQGGSGVGNDILSGGEGNDTANAGNGNDTLSGGIGDDTLDGSTGDDIVAGDDGNDRLIGNGGADSVTGGLDNDTLFGSAGNDTLSGDGGDDELNGNVDADLLRGGIGNDTLNGGSENDTLVGEAGADTLNGGTGSDTLFGGAGIDQLTGSTDADHFVFELPIDASDIVTDFAVGVDLIDLTAVFGVGVVNSGNLSQYVQVTAAGAGSDAFLGVDADGATGGFNFTVVALFQAVTPGALFDVNNFVL
ncbi:MAG TPA: type I secretion C-terminal target domain-containing protein [Methylibium sp.]|nr:type I secretion C-terminal target domain-containing protein [Methylibium sp.]